MNKCFGPILFVVCLSILSSKLLTFAEYRDRENTVFVAILVRNKGHILPYFLSLFSKLEYPKDRMVVWIRTDHNEDNTVEVLQTWLKSSTSEYRDVQIIIDDSNEKFGEIGVAHWTDSRYNHVIALREEAIALARTVWADFIWFLDCDVFLTNRQTLKYLIDKKMVVVAPMLLSDGMYSNYWCAMNEEYYYKRSDQYEIILNRKEQGCFNVPMVYSALLIDLRKVISSHLTFSKKNIPDYHGPNDDVIAFALSAKHFGVPLYVCNDYYYGYIMKPLEETQSLEDDRKYFNNLKILMLSDLGSLPVDQSLSKYVIKQQKPSLGLDKIYVINLERRKERKERMENILHELGLDVTFVKAIDGKSLDDGILDSLNVHIMTEYKDPYHNRTMKKGEIGCFLSHYNLWKQIRDNNYNEVMILEDDVKFENYFMDKLNVLLSDLRSNKIDWDFVYLGRKVMSGKSEYIVPKTTVLVHPQYSYWSLGYLIKTEGAKKLLDGNPLNNLIPVDEYLPIMFNKHPRGDWSKYYPNRDLKAFSAYPLLVHPMKYLYEEGYVSDTEDSAIISTTIRPTSNEEL